MVQGKQRLRLAVAALFIGAAATAAAAWWYAHRFPPEAGVTLYGNIDLRQVSLAFNGSERIAEVLVEEGARVRAGQILARLDRSRLLPMVRQAEATVASQRALLDRLRNGTRPEEIAQARANLDAARAEAAKARGQYSRRQALAARSVVSQQDAEDALAAAAVADAQVEIQRRALELALAGPRAEDIAQAEALLRGSEAQLALVRQQLADAELAAPMDAVVRSRLMEPGEMASPARPVLSLAVTGTKWVRAYVAEPNLGRVRPGQRAAVTTDGFADRPFEGWVGFISPVAEFTPRTVQTEELRTSLVYEVRVFVRDPGDVLRLGMPATVRLQPEAADTAPPPAPAAAAPTADARP